MQARSQTEDHSRQQTVDRHPRRWIVAAYVFISVALAVVGILAFKSLTSVRDSNRAVRHTLEVIDALDTVLTTSLEVESSARGYALSGVPQFLDHFASSTSAVPVSVNTVARLTADNESQQLRCVKLRDLTERRVQLSSDLIAALRDKGPMAAKELVVNGRGRELMDALRALIVDMRTEEQSLLAMRQQAVAHNHHRSGIVLGLAVLFVLLLVTFATVTTVRELALRRRTQEQLRDLTQKLELRITERTRELRDSEERVRALADNMAQLAWMADAGGDIFWYNKRWFDYTGTTLDEMRGWGWKKVHHPDHVERVVHRIKRSFETGIPWEDTFPLRGKDGVYRWFLSRAIPITDTKGNVVRWFGTNTDITDQLKTQDELRRAKTELEQRVQERTAELRETIAQLEAFSYSISHDMRGPLRAMSAFAQLLNEDYGKQLDAQGRVFLARIHDGAQRLDRLIQDVLQYSRMSRTEVAREAVNVERVVRDILHDYPDIAQKTGFIRVDMTCGETSVLANNAALTQVIANLLSNALKFMPAGRTPSVRIWCEGSGDEVRLFVEDNGIGIPRDKLDTIFGIFQRAHGSEYAGTGIGLSIVKKAVERMGGSIGVESEVGKGTRFWVALPKANTADPESSPVLA